MRCSLLTLSTYLDGELAPDRSGELEAHLVACQRCSDGLGHLREEQEHIRGLAAVTASAGAADELLGMVGIAVVDAAPQAEAAAPAPQFLLELAERRADAEAAEPEHESDHESDRDAIVELSGSAATPAPIPDAVAASAAAAEAVTETSAPAPIPEPVVERDAAPVEQSLFAQTAVFDDADFDEVEDVDSGVDPSPPAPQAWSSRWTPAMQSRLSALHPANPERVIALPTSVPARIEPAETEQHEEQPVESAAAEIVASEPATPDASIPEATIFEPEPEIPEASVPAPSTPEASVPESELEETVSLPAALIAPDEPLPGTTAAADTFEDAPDQPKLADPSPIGPQTGTPATWFDRARDAVALRWALMRGASPTADDLDEEAIQIVSGAGAPSRTSRTRRPVTESTMQSTREREPARPAAMAMTSPLSPFDSLGMPVEMMAPVEAFDRPVAPVDEPAVPQRAAEPAEPSAETLAEPVKPIAEPVPVPRPTASAGRHVRAVHGQKRSWKPPRAPRVPRPRPVALSGPLADRRLWAFGGTVVILALIGLLVGKSTTLPSHPAGGVAPNPTAIPQQSAPALSSPAPTAVATPRATPRPTSVPTPSVANPTSLTGAQNLGSGATEVSVQDVRYGQHPNDFRIVFDLNGSGSPTTVVGFGNATTLYVEFTGVTGIPSPTQPPSGGVATAITLLQPSPITGKTIYKITLSGSANLSTIYLQSPLRLVIDLTT